MKTLLIAICFAFAVPSFASTTAVKKQMIVEIGDNPQQPVPPTPPKP